MRPPRESSRSGPSGPVIAGTAALALALGLGGCDPIDPPPGESIGRFQFEAVLDTSGTLAAEFGLPRCRFPGSPAQIGFDGLLSYEPYVAADAEETVFYLQVDDTVRQGLLALETASFRTRSPQSPTSDPRGAPRSLDGCDCSLFFLEHIDGALVTGAPPSGCGFPAIDAQGLFDPASVGGVCGMVREEVRPSTGDCTCDTPSGREPAPETCLIVYRLEGRRSQ